MNNIITFSIRTTNLEFNGVKLELQFYIVGRITSLYYIIIQLVIQHNIILSMTTCGTCISKEYVDKRAREESI